MCNIVHVYVKYANVLKGLQFPTPTLHVKFSRFLFCGVYYYNNKESIKLSALWTIQCQTVGIHIQFKINDI